MTHQKRYTAEELRAFAIEVSAFSAAAMSERHYEESNAMACIGTALLQAAHTESQVAGLVDAVNSIVNNIETGASAACVQRIAMEALSKFMGEV